VDAHLICMRAGDRGGEHQGVYEQIVALALLTLKMGRLRALSILQGREVVRALAKLPELVSKVLTKAPLIEELRPAGSTERPCTWGAANSPSRSRALKLKESPTYRRGIPRPRYRTSACVQPGRQLLDQRRFREPLLTSSGSFASARTTSRPCRIDERAQPAIFSVSSETPRSGS